MRYPSPPRMPRITEGFEWHSDEAQSSCLFPFPQETAWPPSLQRKQVSPAALFHTYRRVEIHPSQVHFSSLSSFNIMQPHANWICFSFASSVFDWHVCSLFILNTPGICFIIIYSTLVNAAFTVSRQTSQSTCAGRLLLQSAVSSFNSCRLISSWGR